MKKLVKVIVSITFMLCLSIFNMERVQAIDVGVGIEGGGEPKGIIQVEVRNLWNSTGKNLVGDRLQYTITIYNDEPFSTWKDIKILDVLPNGIDLDEGDGVRKNGYHTEHVYNRTTRELAIPISPDLAGDDETLEGVVTEKDVVVITFLATINATAYGTTIQNTASVVGSNSDVIGQDEGIYVEPLPNWGAHVTVEYHNEDGDSLLKDLAIIKEVGEPYTVKIKEFEGYVYKEHTGDLSGIVSNEPKKVTLIYAKKSSVLVHHVDEEGNHLVDPITLEGGVGSSYIAEKISLDGYELLRVEGNLEGFIEEEIQTIVFTYKKVASDPIVLTPVETTSPNTGLLKSGSREKLLLMFSSAIIVIAFYTKLRFDKNKCINKK